MGRKSKKEGLCVYVKLIHFALQQKLTLQSNYVPIKINLKNLKDDMTVRAPRDKRIFLQTTVNTPYKVPSGEPYAE